MLQKFKCECGKYLSFRCIKRHLTTKKPNGHTQNYINKMIGFVELNKVQRLAWLKSEGQEAVSDNAWGISVLSEKTKLEDWTFDTPRKRGQSPPSVIKEMKISRKGSGNPVNKTKPNYDLKELKAGAKNAWNSVQNEDLRIKTFYDLMNKKYPEFCYSLSDLVSAKYANIQSKNTIHERGEFSYKNLIVSTLLDIPIEEILSIRRMDRGKMIKKGQDNPKTRKKLLRVLRENKENHLTVGFVSKSQKKLHAYIKKIIDPTAILEKQIDYLDTWKSFDVYSPKYDCFFEMHGAIWHDTKKCKPSMISLVEKNVKNDKIKEELIKGMDKKLFIFWDDKQTTWITQLKRVLKELNNEN